MRRRWEITPDLPLFLSRENTPDGSARALSPDSARRILHDAFSQARIVNDGRLGTHALRKTWAKNVYRHSGHDIMVVKAALHHADVSTTQIYLDVDESAVEAAIRKCDFTRPRCAPDPRPLRMSRVAHAA
jgi:site-specific recombinase XerD